MSLKFTLLLKPVLLVLTRGAIYQANNIDELLTDLTRPTNVIKTMWCR